MPVRQRQDVQEVLPAVSPSADAQKDPVVSFGKGSHLHLIDGSGFIFRAYHALPPLTRKSDRLPIGAVAGFCNMVWKMLQETRGAATEDEGPAA